MTVLICEIQDVVVINIFHGLMTQKFLAAIIITFVILFVEIASVEPCQSSTSRIV